MVKIIMRGNTDIHRVESEEEMTEENILPFICLSRSTVSSDCFTVNHDILPDSLRRIKRLHKAAVATVHMFMLLLTIVEW